MRREFLSDRHSLTRPQGKNLDQANELKGENMSNIAWIGLGNMGLRLASRLLKAGHNVRGCDPSDAAGEKARQQGIETGPSIEDAVRDADYVFTMLPNGRIAEAVYAGEEGVFEHAKKTAMLIDCSTIEVDTAQSIHKEAQVRSLTFYDAPVSGGTVGAENGTLTMMVGGDSGRFSELEGILRHISAKVVHTGDGGTGQAVKICNNLMALINQVGLAEAAVLADRLGVDQRVLHDVATDSSGQSWMLDHWYPYPGIIESSAANRDFAPSFAAALALKDINLAVEAAYKEQLPLEVGTAARGMYQRLSNIAGNDYDASAVRLLVDGTAQDVIA